MIIKRNILCLAFFSILLAILITVNVSAVQNVVSTGFHPTISINPDAPAGTNPHAGTNNSLNTTPPATNPPASSSPAESDNTPSGSSSGRSVSGRNVSFGSPSLGSSSNLSSAINKTGTNIIKLSGLSSANKGLTSNPPAASTASQSINAGILTISSISLTAILLVYLFLYKRKTAGDNLISNRKKSSSLKKKR